MDLHNGWILVDVNEQARLDEELRRELKPGHRLYGTSLTVVARHRKRGVFLTFITGTDQVVDVHLTWAGDYEKPPRPEARVYRNPATWRKAIADRAGSPEGAKAS
jgi:hypothetical protein